MKNIIKKVLYVFITAGILASGPVFAAGIVGEVITTMDGGGYTYVEVQNSSGKYWAAVQKRKIKVGEYVKIPDSVPMEGFYSKTLNKTFDKIIFAQGLTVVDKASVATSGKASSSNVKPASGGLTVEQIYKDMVKLKGQTIKVSGKVVKYNSGIMGMNFVHIVDGTGGNGENTLTFTTKDVVKVGDTVTGEGIVVLDKDFGMGYFYKLLIQESKFKKN